MKGSLKSDNVRICGNDCSKEESILVCFQNSPKRQWLHARPSTNRVGKTEITRKQQAKKNTHLLLSISSSFNDNDNNRFIPSLSSEYILTIQDKFPKEEVVIAHRVFIKRRTVCTVLLQFLHIIIVESN